MVKRKTSNKSSPNLLERKGFGVGRSWSSDNLLDKLIGEIARITDEGWHYTTGLSEKSGVSHYAVKRFIRQYWRWLLLAKQMNAFILPEVDAHKGKRETARIKVIKRRLPPEVEFLVG